MAKGSSFERKICKQLSMWWTDNKRDDVFWRTAGSGARAKVRSKRNKSTFGQYGDVTATDPIGKALIDVFTIELKCGYNHATLIDLYDRKENAAQQQWDKFLCQVLEDTENSGSKYWMLICKRDRRDSVVIIPFCAARQLPRLKTVSHIRGFIYLKSGKQIKFYLTNWQIFLATVNSFDIKSMWE